MKAVVKHPLCRAATGCNKTFIALLLNKGGFRKRLGVAFHPRKTDRLYLYPVQMALNFFGWSCWWWEEDLLCKPCSCFKVWWTWPRVRCWLLALHLGRRPDPWLGRISPAAFEAGGCVYRSRFRVRATRPLHHHHHHRLDLVKLNGRRCH